MKLTSYMGKESNYIAVDVGASSGRVMKGVLKDHQLSFEQLHRFENAPIPIGDTAFGDVLSMFKSILDGINRYQGPITSIGIDTFGMSVGLLD